MALKDLQEKLVSLLQESDIIAGKAELSPADAERLQVIVQEGNGLKSQLIAMGEAQKLADWGRQSAGMLPLAGGATLLGMSPAGGMDIEVREKNGRKSILISDDGEMLVNPNVYKTLTNPDYGRAFKSYLRLGQNGMSGDALKTLQEGSDPAGGYTVPEELLNRLIAREPAPRTLQSKVTRVTTSRDALNVPQLIYTTDNQYTSGMRVTWTGEIPASATTHNVTDPSFGQVHIPVWTAMMSLPLTNDLIEDSTVNLISFMSDKFNETIELLYENMLINGTGVGQPEGIINNGSVSSINSGAAAALTWDGLTSLLYALPEQYDQNAVVAMNKTNTAQALAKLKDGDGRPYWATSPYDLTGERLQKPIQGYPVVFNAFMPNVGAGNKAMIFGDFSGYWLVNRIGMSIQVLRELYAETNKVMLLGRIRFGGKLVEYWRLRLGNVAA
ncbi:MAG: phage major capsid protein [Dehalococcoidia bacterium]|nr:phage major capsid protein [Dehalococcoidia bacterium]